MTAPDSGRTDLPPWLEQHWNQLWRARVQGRLGHAWLLNGIPGLGKRRFARCLAQALLCQQADENGYPCGSCAECRLFMAGNHPDLLAVAPDTDSASHEIKVDAIRELASRDNLTPHRGRQKVILIESAESMNRAAANSLLKTLEEPASTTVLLLVADDATQLPATIRSRCQQLIFVPPQAQVALPWLEQQIPLPIAPHELLLRLSQGAPLRALSLSETDYLRTREQGFEQFLAVANGQGDPLSAAAAWQSLDLAMLIDALSGWICDIARLHGDPTTASLTNSDLREALSDLAQRLSGDKLHQFLTHVLRARVLIQSSVNRQLLLESLLIRWALVAMPTSAGRST